MNLVKKTLKSILKKMPLDEKKKRKLNNAWAEYKMAKEEKEDQKGTLSLTSSPDELLEYTKCLVASYGKRMPEYCDFEKHETENTRVYLSAYYLTQFHPNPQNDAWWGKGTTEWNNVNQAVPQFVDHYQPRKPGELGYYDLRLKENMERQIELAKNYGIMEFCFYYYWFDGERLLERPLDMFLKNADLDIEFSYCWANENWTKRFSGTDAGALMKITQSVDSYSRFIDAVLEDMRDPRYHRVNGKPILSVYRPSSIPDPVKVLQNWQKKAKDTIGTELYLVAVLEANSTIDWISVGFDALTEFQPRSVEQNCKEITNEVRPIRKDFAGKVYDYADLVLNKKYNVNLNRKCYPAVMPMWDNTARRNHRGTIFHGATPELYKKWLTDEISIVKNNKTLDEQRIYLNAWNEWGEGAYMEPDYAYGYAYLQATYDALNSQK